VGGFEQWIAEQWWEPTPRGWRVRGRFHDWKCDPNDKAENWPDDRI
jgi:hypothetical protein